LQPSQIAAADLASARVIPKNSDGGVETKHIIKREPDVKTKPVQLSVCSNEAESWDTIWKWWWFTRAPRESTYWEENQAAMTELSALLTDLHVKSVLDSSCGLGYKTILLAKMGYECEGSDASPVAIKYAPHLAEEQELRLRFFQSTYEELGQKCGRMYDCVFSDYFDEIATRETLEASARGIHSVLHHGGRLVFSGIPAEWSKSDLQQTIQREWEERTPFEVSAPCERDGLRVIELEVDEKTPEGILEKRIFLIEDEGVLRVEVAFMTNRRKWIFSDFDQVLAGAGFGSVRTVKAGGTLFTIATK
jgi:2-polyprenyl-3-methyl-5-hydroxy-6-metoxy-1,4-benzoquinol methylase